MFGEDKNFKDSLKDTSLMPAPYQAADFGLVSYTKTNKLISALYMVTDIMDNQEPLRNKLRTLGVEIISDIHIGPSQAGKKIYEIMSLLDIAFAVGLVSEMNCNILKNEFIKLDQSIKEYIEAKQKTASIDFLIQKEPETKVSRFSSLGHQPVPRHRNAQSRTRIGVQRGSTLLQALSDKNLTHGVTASFNDLKRQRREDILTIIKGNQGGVTIKDIKDAIKDMSFKSLAACGEKTLQRELISMVKDGVLKKTGEKRWSRYFTT